MSNARFNLFTSLIFSSVIAAAYKTYDNGKDFRFYHKTKHKVADKTLGQRFLKEFKITCKNYGEMS